MVESWAKAAQRQLEVEWRQDEVGIEAPRAQVKTGGRWDDDQMKALSATIKTQAEDRVARKWFHPTGAKKVGKDISILPFNFLSFTPFLLKEMKRNPVFPQFLPVFPLRIYDVNQSS